MTASSNSQFRASDQDRDRVLDLLQTAYADGRLTKDEYDQRAGYVLSAQVFAQLDTVTADLVVPAARPLATSRRTNSMAVASLVCGVGQMILFPFTTIPAIVCGHIARHQIRRTGENGSGLATGGLVLGYIGLAVLACLVAVTAVLIGHLHATLPAQAPNPIPPPGVPPG